MSNRMSVILAAALGGVAPNLFKIALVLTGGPAAFPGIGFVLSYTFGLMLLAGLGVGTALALKETNTKKAIFIGLGLPAFLQVSASNISQAVTPKPGAEKPEKVVRLNFDFATNAYAEPVRTRRTPAPVPTQTPQRTLDINASGTDKPQSVTFSSPKGKTMKKLSADDFQDGKGTVAVPPDAVSFSVNYEGAQSKEVPIEQSTRKNAIDVEVKEKPWTGLWQAIGANPASQYQVDVSAPPPENKPGR